jgi:hypothetical protein
MELPFHSHADNEPEVRQRNKEEKNRMSELTWGETIAFLTFGQLSFAEGANPHDHLDVLFTVGKLLRRARRISQAFNLIERRRRTK